MEDAHQERRLSAHLFRLLRSGRLHRACRLAAQTSQPWRTLSIAGAGLHGPLTLGSASAQADPAGSQEALASQDELGFGGAQALWKWACFQVCPRVYPDFPVVSQHDEDDASAWRPALWPPCRCFYKYHQAAVSALDVGKDEFVPLFVTLTAPSPHISQIMRHVCLLLGRLEMAKIGIVDYEQRMPKDLG